VSVPDAGVPRAGVTNVGELANTAAPVPVSSVKAPARFAELNEPKTVALPVDVTAPVRLALVVTLPAVKPDAVPVMFVPTSADGVPSAGVTNVGELAKTSAPVPVSSVTAAARLADDGVPSHVATPVPNDVMPVPPRATLSVPVVPATIGKPVALVKTPLAGVPRAGVTSVGELAKTSAPVPVSSVTAAARFALEGVPRNAAIPVPNDVMPVPPLATGRVPATPDARFTVGVASVTAAPAPAPSVTTITF